ncbi:S9 family peptidase [Massilia sp. TS11]|uniref:S9 family peptidase n=1 Tax=Massilia sp. TS11 TaxID=2908003 RepID=UPI001EDB57DD|nr:S9 family peptidase [Massilia sp. TS11]MCG2586133.1 S9 family peptidase [Massilia sp. TS11]
MKALTLFAGVGMLATSLAYADTPAIREFRSLALDPSGTRIASVETVSAATPGKRPHASIVVRDAKSGAIVAQYDPCAACSYEQPSWSADGQRMAFIGSEAARNSATLYLVSAGKTEALTQVKGIASTPRFAPDGQQIALLATIDAKKAAGATEAGARLVGEIGSSEDEQRIGVVPVQGGSLRLVSPDDTYVYEYDWAPDSKGFAVTSAKGNGDSNWWIATLGYVDLASGKLRVIAAPKMQMNLPRVAPDGQSVAFVGGLMSDFGSIGGDVYQVPLAGGTPRNLTPNYRGSFNGLAWRGKQLYASALIGADHAAVRIDPASAAVQVLWQAPVTTRAAARQGRIDFSADGKLSAFIAEDFTSAERIMAGPVAKPVAITQDNAHLQAVISARSLSWTNEGFQVQGWLVGPLKTEPGKKYPMVVTVHGGPAAAVSPRYVGEGDLGNPLVRELTQRGYFVFMPNPRGSYGQGSAFTSANRADFGGGDWRDILAGVDTAIAQAPIDGQRLGLMGHSYGGFMTMWGVTHSLRFKAAVAGAGIANWISYYGQNGIDTWMPPFFGATAYDDPAVYRRASPIETIKAARTPTLIYVGERDVECPPAQSMEFWKGLKAQGVETSLVIYEGEGHALRKPEHQKDLRARQLAWFDKYLK